MEYPPYGHHHRRDEEDREGHPPSARPFHGGPSPPPQAYYSANAPPPPQVTHVHHSSHTGGGSPYDYPPPSYASDQYPPPPSHVSHSSHVGGGGYGYPPPGSDHYPSHQNTNYSSSASSVHHVSHDSPQSENENNPHHFRPHMPSFVHHHEHQKHEGSGSDLVAKPSVRVYTKAETDYSLTIRDGTVILARSNPSDPFQHWIKDEKYSIKVKDEQGYPSFSLVNKATGQALKHSTGATHPVQLIPYNANSLDESVLWTESKDLGDSYRTIRMVNNIRLNVDALNGDKNHGGVHDGTKIVLWEWKKGDNQRWKIVPY